MPRRRHVSIFVHDERGFQIHAPRDWIERTERVTNNRTALVMRQGFNGPKRLLVDLPLDSVLAQLRSGDDDESE
jgi:hypothetical protein